MSADHVIGVDLAKVWSRDRSGEFKYRTTLAWGDDVEVKDIARDQVQVAVTGHSRQPDGSVKPRVMEGFIRPPKSSGIKPDEVVAERHDAGVLKVDFVDVQQGDGSVLETPAGRVILVDGGDNQLFARYLATRFPDNTEDRPKDVDAIVVTHGDADHFVGLTEIQKSETHSVGYKRLFISPRRVYHNGLVKRPSSPGGKNVPDDQLLGETRELGEDTFITGLVDDVLEVPDGELNEPFRAWKSALKAWNSKRPIEFRRLAFGDRDAFNFVADEGVRVDVLGPLTRRIDGKDALLFLGTPRGHAHLGVLGSRPSFTGKSASHTINGHSIVLRVTYGKVRLLFAGDLNEQSEEALAEGHGSNGLSLRSEVFKVPHHGSGDFSSRFLKAVAPVISVVSSGDESARKEYIHPRATLMGTLGRYSRPGHGEPLVFVTELVAFFQAEGFVRPELHVLRDGEVVLEDGKAKKDRRAKKTFFAFSRAAFGIVKVRTDGRRLLVWTNSGQVALKEAYAFQMEGTQARPVEVRRA